jgi:pimeloyl-ACP methyl ester carboxylesterase
MERETQTAAPDLQQEPDRTPGSTSPGLPLRGLPFRPLQIGRQRKRRGERRAVRMVPSTLVTNGRKIRYSVSDNINAHGPEGPGSPPIWAVNVHGYFAGGTMYWRESANLAEKMGWRVLNPNLPGFGGSDPLPWQQVSISEISAQVTCLMDNLGIERAVLLGHSMGGAVAVQIADAHPDRVLGIIYRDGAATPEWKQRRGAVVAALSPLLPGSANLVDLTLSVVLDSPDLLIGRRLSSTMRGLWPDTHRNLRSFGGIMPVGSMLMSLDMRKEVGRLAGNGIPVLAEWGCFDRVVTARCAEEFRDLTGAQLVWVPGGHSWMLPRPQGQADILKHVEAGRQFLVRACERNVELAERPSHLGPGDFGPADLGPADFGPANAGLSARTGTPTRAAFTADAGFQADAAAVTADTALPTDNGTAAEPVPIFRHHTAG